MKSQCWQREWIEVPTRFGSSSASWLYSCSHFKVSSRWGVRGWISCLSISPSPLAFRYALLRVLLLANRGKDSFEISKLRNEGSRCIGALLELLCSSEVLWCIETKIIITKDWTKVWIMTVCPENTNREISIWQFMSFNWLGYFDDIRNNCCTARTKIDSSEKIWGLEISWPVSKCR